MDVSEKKVFAFYAGFLMQRSLEVNPGCMPIVRPLIHPVVGTRSVLKMYRGTRNRYFLKKYRVLYMVLDTVLFQKKINNLTVISIVIMTNL